MAKGEGWFVMSVLQVLWEDAGGVTSEPGVGADYPAGPAVRPSLRLDHVSTESLYVATCARRTGYERDEHDDGGSAGLRRTNQ